MKEYANEKEKDEIYKIFIPIIRKWADTPMQPINSLIDCLFETGFIKFQKIEEPPAKTYTDIKPHYFVRHNLDKHDRFCDKCGLYFTDEIHIRNLKTIK